MSLKVWNNTNLNLWVAIAHEEEECTGNRWRKTGWWKLTPDQTKTVWTRTTNNKYFFYYAFDENLRYEWKGDYYTALPKEIFNRCWDESGGDIYGMRIFKATRDDDRIILGL